MLHQFVSVAVSSRGKPKNSCTLLEGVQQHGRFSKFEDSNCLSCMKQALLLPNLCNTCFTSEWLISLRDFYNISSYRLYLFMKVHAISSIICFRPTLIHPLLKIASPSISTPIPDLCTEVYRKLFLSFVKMCNLEIEKWNVQCSSGRSDYCWSTVFGAWFSSPAVRCR